MGTSTKSKWRFAPGIVAVAIAAALSQPATASTAIGHSVHFHLVTTATRVNFLGEKQLPGGDYVASWHLFGETVEVAAPAGSTVIVPKPAWRHASVTVQPPSSLHKGSLTALAAAYARSGKSVAQDALAVGYTAAQARQLARQVAGTRRAQYAYSPGQIIETPCASVTADGGNAYGRTCDVQKMIQDNGGGNWIIGDEVTGSGNDTGPFGWENLMNLTAYVNYGSHNTIVQWRPNSSVPEGNCSTVSLGLAYSGVSLSDSSTVCPDQMDPYGTNTSNRFGSSWTGCDRDVYVEGVNSVDVDNNPWNASDWPGLTVSISWGYCF